MPLTELVHYFNKRNRLDGEGSGEDGFEIADGRVRARLGGSLHGTLFQPLVERSSGRVDGHEACLQSLSRAAETVPAQALFLDARDDAELVRLDRNARTLHALNFLLQRDQRDGFLSLNVHPQLIRSVRDHHGQVFESVLARCGLTPERIVLELNDDGFESAAQLAVAIAEYRARGYRVAIDNFGRHSASLERLALLGPDIVKLDRSLVGHAGHLDTARRVVSGLVPEIHRLGMQVVIQFIETPLQRELALESGADWLQGYRIARPAPDCRPVIPSVRVRAIA